MHRMFLVLFLLASGSATAQTAQQGGVPPAAGTPPAGGTVAPGAPAPPATGRTSDKSDYVVGAQDVLKVLVFDEPQLSGTFRVDTDGAFQYPFVGRVVGAGRTLRSIEEELARRLAEGFVRRPQVSIEVDQARSRSLFVVGEVRSPGKYPLTPQMTLIEALAQAGYTTSAAGSDVLILRAADPAAGREVVPGQAAETVTISLTELQSGRSTTAVTLREGDTIFVPKSERFFVSGFVKAPGAFGYERGMTVLQALTLAGGVSDRGSTRGVRVQRVVDGKKVEISVKMTDPVLANDTIIVRQRLL